MQNGDKVFVINEFGKRCANGIFYGKGIPTADLKTNFPGMIHYAILVEGELRYYPAGFNTVQIET